MGGPMVKLSPPLGEVTVMVDDEGETIENTASLTSEGSPSDFR